MKKAGRKPLPNPYNLSRQSAEFYRKRTSEGIYPTEEAMAALRSDEQRFNDNWTKARMAVRKKLLKMYPPPFRPRQARKMPELPRKVVSTLVVRKPPAPVAAIRIPITYEMAMARKSV